MSDVNYTLYSLRLTLHEYKQRLSLRITLQFTNHHENKRILCELLSKMTVAKLEPLEKDYVVIQGTTAYTAGPKTHSQHEAENSVHVC